MTQPFCPDPHPHPHMKSRIPRNKAEEFVEKKEEGDVGKGDLSRSISVLFSALLYV